MNKQEPTEHLDFLQAQICHLHHARAHQLFESIGLFRGQPKVLLALWEQEGQTQKELAERLGITPATITKMLQRMERAGYIQRQPDTVDQRISRVHLTEMGHQVRGQVEWVWETMEAETFAHFSPEELVSLRRFMTQIRDNLAIATGEEP